MTPANGTPLPEPPQKNAAAACPLWRDNLKAFADGEMPLLRRLALQRHLSRCAACSAEVEAMQRIARSLRQAEEADTSRAAVSLDPALRSRILSAMQEAVPPGEAQTSSEPLSRPAFRFRPATAFAIAAGALFVGIVTLPLLSPLREQAQNATVSATQSTGGAETASAPAATRAQPSAGVYAPELASKATEAREGAGIGGGTTVAAGTAARETAAAGASASPATGASKTGRMAETAKRSARTGYAGQERAASAVSPTGREAQENTIAAAPLGTALTPLRHEESLTLKVARVAEAADAVERMARLSGGAMISRSSVYAQEDGGSGAMTNITLGLQFPADRAEDFVARLSEIGRVTERSRRVPGIAATQQQRQEASVINLKVHLREK